MFDFPKYAWRVAVPFEAATPQRNKIDRQLHSHHDVGVPVGGLGSGAINRGPSGGFTRWTLEPGRVEYWEHPINGFTFWQQTGSTAATSCRALRNRTSSGAPPGWEYDATGQYYALFPKAIHEYPGLGGQPVTLQIIQCSPVIPSLGNDIDLPAGLFRLHLTNTGSGPASAAIMFSLANLCGRFSGVSDHRLSGGIAGQYNIACDEHALTGVLFQRELAGPPGNGDGQFLIGCAKHDDFEITRCVAFDPIREGRQVWDNFAQCGRLDCVDGAEDAGEKHGVSGVPWVSGGGFSEFPAAEVCGALAARCELTAGETRSIDMCLIFDLPVVEFGQGRRWRRHYTTRWGAKGKSAARIGTHVLQQADAWLNAAEQFHEQAIQRLGPSLNSAAAALAINELYFLSEGLCIWTTADNGQDAHFALIECPDYPLYNTLDLWVYGSHAVAEWFPDIARSVTLDYAQQVTVSDPQVRHHLRSSRRFFRQSAGMLPHDLGAPSADPFIRANDYVYQDSSVWKDLNTQFVMTAWRDCLQANDAFLIRIYPAVQAAMAALLAHDSDGDGLIENSGFPDQTFDNIPMHGVSVYCGGLWLAALRATAAMAERLGDTAEQRRWQTLSHRAEPAFETALWNGRCFNIDTHGAFSDALFTEQLFGPMLARIHGLGDVVSPDKARTALQTIFKSNFEQAGDGRGAISVVSATLDSSLYAPSGEEGLQWDEVLVGFNYSLAAQLRTYGLHAECQQLLTALANELGTERGLMFRTPAAFELQRNLFRAQMNLRPLGIWMLPGALRAANG